MQQPFSEKAVAKLPSDDLTTEGVADKRLPDVLSASFVARELSRRHRGHRVVLPETHQHLPLVGAGLPELAIAEPTMQLTSAYWYAGWAKGSSCQRAISCGANLLMPAGSRGGRFFSTARVNVGSREFERSPRKLAPRSSQVPQPAMVAGRSLATHRMR